MSTRRPHRKTIYRLSAAGRAAGLGTGSIEVILLELCGRVGLTLSTADLMDRTGLANNTITIAAKNLIDQGLVKHVGYHNRNHTFCATPDGRALAELIREEVNGAVRAPAPTTEPDPEPSVAPSRETMEHTIWQWCWQLTREQLSSTSHAFIAELHQLLERDGRLP